MRLVDALTAFLEQVRLRGSPHSARAYGCDLRGWLDGLAARGVCNVRDLETLRPVEIRSYLSSLHEHLDRSSIARRIHAFRSFVRYLNAQDWLKADVAALVPSIKVQRKLPTLLSQDEVLEILSQPNPKSAKGRRDIALLEILYGSGVRVSEAIGIRIRDLDLSAGWARIQGKGSKERFVPLTAPTLKAIRAYLEGREATPDMLLFDLTTRSVARIVLRVARAAGVTKPISPHSFRHACATHLLAGGADIKTIKDLLGHENVTTTAGYTHLDAETLVQTYREHPLKALRSGGRK